MINMNNILIFDKQDMEYNIDKDTNIYHFSINSSSNILINIVKEGVTLNYYYNNINYDDNSFNLNIKHMVSNTYSNVFNHGVNVFSNKLKYRVDSIVLKDSYKCKCIQDSKIINLGDGNSTIWPNLLIDNYDVVAEHAAYIGKFNDSDLFYLTSRGISKNSAYKLLLKGFLVNEDIEGIDDFIREIDRMEV